MKCLVCEKWSARLICRSCNDDIALYPQKRVSYDDFVVYSFFHYSDIEYLLKSKYSLIGSRIYKILARKACEYFSRNVAGGFANVYGIGIDDRVRQFYSHSGVIVHEFRHIFISQINALVATNDISYAGKSLQYRQENKKDFVYRGKSDINAVLIDDIITTGISMKEARDVLEKHDVNVLFGLSLCDARY